MLFLISRRSTVGPTCRRLSTVDSSAENSMIGSSRHHRSFSRDATAMQIDWGKTIDDILASNISCLRCGRMDPYACVGYSRSATAAEYAPRCQSCSRQDGWEARNVAALGE